MTKVEIANLALSHIGNTKPISTFSELSEEARKCSQWFDVAFKELLEERFSFATKTATLSLVEEEPNDEWGYSYRKPTDCMAIIGISSSIVGGSQLFNPDLQSPFFLENQIPLEESSDDSGGLIYTNVESAQLKYIRLCPIEILPTHACITLSFLLASYVSSSLTKGDQAALPGRMRQMYEDQLTISKSKDARNNQKYRSNESAFTAARKG